MAAVDNALKFVIKGILKYGTKIDTMEKNYEGAKDYAIARYKAAGFKPERVEAYTDAWTYMPDNYKEAMEPFKALKWCFVWVVQMYGVDVAREVASRLRARTDILDKVGLSAADVDRALSEVVGS